MVFARNGLITKWTLYEVTPVFSPLYEMNQSYFQELYVVGSYLIYSIPNVFLVYKIFQVPLPVPFSDQLFPNTQC